MAKKPKDAVRGHPFAVTSARSNGHVMRPGVFLVRCLSIVHVTLHFLTSFLLLSFHR